MCMMELATNTMMDDRAIGSQSAVREPYLASLGAKWNARIADARLHFSGAAVKQAAGLSGIPQRTQDEVGIR